MLQRRLGLLQAASLNMSLMVGIGPFVTIPILLDKMAGPQAMLGWILGALVAIGDGMVWSELAATFPGSGGTYHFYDAVYGESRVGRLLKFVFVWQFLFSGPLEVASGAIGLAQYLGFFFPALAAPAWSWGWLSPAIKQEVAWTQVAAIGVMVIVTVMAYRRIDSLGRLMVVLCAGMFLTVTWVIVTGFTHFDSSRAFDFPANAWHVDRRWAFGLGAALGIAMYDYLGYYQICYLGDEVINPSRTIPLSILISTVVISLVYLVMNVGILGILPWRQVVKTEHVATDLMLQVHGLNAARLVTIMIIWTALASVFAAVLGYSRIPYASARAGHFFRYFAALHPRGDFPHRSLLLICGIAMMACLAKLGTVIDALLASRIFIQFAGQIVTLFYWRSRPDRRVPGFRMPLYPLPAIIALVGWLYVFVSVERDVMKYAIGSLVLGIVAFGIWDAFRPPASLARVSNDGESLASPPESE